jgi:RNA polymerase sigma-54 factor
MVSIAMHAEHRQQQKLSPRLLQAVRLLQLSSLDFTQELHASLERNPFLEIDDPEPLEADSEIEADAVDEPVAPALSEESDGLDAGAATAVGDDSERELWMADGASSPRHDASGDFDLMSLMPAQSTLADHLHGQLNLLPLESRDLALARAVVDSLDDDGYLRLELDELSGITGLTPLATCEELQVALRRVQSLDPAGVGARGVGECLALQVPLIDDPQLRELAHRIVTEKLDALAAKDAHGLSRAFQVPLDRIEAACKRIRQFDPRPGWRFGASQVQYIVPDIIVKKVRNVWTATLNPAVVPKLRLNQVYAEMFQRHRGANSTQLADHLRDARWALRNVEQRFSTILSVAQSIVKRQARFFEHGALAMKPLGLREIAEEIGLHESTVSRVTNNKYMATPLGVLELKSFFSRAMTATSGTAFTGTAVRGLIKEMVAGEAPTAPLSDAEIARQLALQGLVVARRTVTKYRHLMRLESVERRRQVQ